MFCLLQPATTNKKNSKPKNEVTKKNAQEQWEQWKQKDAEVSDTCYGMLCKKKKKLKYLIYQKY